MGGASDPLNPLAPFTSADAEGGAANASHAGFTRVESPDDIARRLDKAQDEGRPVMLDFYADWCISCKVMERNVFSDRQVIQALAPFTLLQIDLTDNTPEQQALLDRLGLFGPPAILFYNAQGQEMTGQRVLGEMDRDEFMAHLQSLPLDG